jgi:hypothetical protein
VQGMGKKGYKGTDQYTENAYPHESKGEVLWLGEEKYEGVDDGGGQVGRNVTDWNHGSCITCKKWVNIFKLVSNIE